MLARGVEVGGGLVAVPVVGHACVSWVRVVLSCSAGAGGGEVGGALVVVAEDELGLPRQGERGGDAAGPG